MPLRSCVRRSLLLVTLVSGVVGIAGACSSSGGPITGPPDTHCSSKVQPTSQSACQGGIGGSSSSSSSSSSSGAGGAEMGGDYGATLENAEGDDDDCKYHVKFTSTDIAQNKDVTFTVVLTNKVDNTPVAGAGTVAESFLSDTHPGPNTDQKVTESQKGTYQVGPVRFDAPGKWTLRFHFFEECTDLNEQSPHGHVAFFVNVP